MIRVLHFVSTPSIGSGVMSVIMNYYRHMDRSKIQFDFLCFIPCEDSYEREINELGGRVFFVPKPGSSVNSFKKLCVFLATYGREYEYLHNHEVYLSFLLQPLARKYNIRKFIIHCHATNYSDRKSSAIRNLILCLPIRFMKCERFACSQAAGEFLYGEKKVQNGMVKIFYNAIESKKYKYDAQKRDTLRTEMGITDKQVVVGHVGRFAVQKNHEFLLKIFHECNNILPDSVLLCVGDGPLYNEIKKKAFQMGIIDNIIFLGQRNDVPELLNAMDVFLLPSLFEGFPVSLVEAECNGLSCLIADTISDEMVSERVQRYSLHNSPASWAEKVMELAKTKHSANLNPPVYDINKQADVLQAFYLEY